MANGNLSRVLVWVNDTVIVKKQLDNKILYFVASKSCLRIVMQKVRFDGIQLLMKTARHYGLVSSLLKAT